MIFSWLKRRRRRRLVSEPFPESWMEILHRNVRHYQGLSVEQRKKLRDDLRILVAEKNWEGCAGLSLTDEVRVTIAAQACLLTLGMANEQFDNVQTILVYPNEYVAPEEVEMGGIVLQTSSMRLGEAWRRGPVILSWEDALAAGQGRANGENVVLHEFAHQLDMQNGDVDGAPPLASGQARRRWRDVMSQEFDRLVNDCEQGRPTLLDCYGVTDPAEFFAVSTECFFERPRNLRDSHPELYEVLSEFYRQDPAANDKASLNK